MKSENAKRFLPALMAAAVLGACDDGDGLTGPEATATVSGRVEQTVEPVSATSVGALPLLLSATSAANVEAAATVDVAEVRADGSLRALASADVRPDGTYTVEEVPAGRAGLVVVARASGGADVGRVLLAATTRAGERLDAAPIDGETTLQARVYSRLRARGESEEDAGAAELALLLRVDAGIAGSIAASEARVEALADAYVIARDALTGAFQRLGANLDAAARGEALAEAFAAYQARLHAGESEARAHPELVAAWAEAAADAGVGVEVAALAAAGARRGLELALETSHADERARAEMLRVLAAMNLEARVDLAASVPDEAASQREAVASALRSALARAHVGGATAAEVRAIVEAADADAQADLLSELAGLLAAVPADVRSGLEARLQDAFARADLDARFGGEASLAEVLDRLPAYLADLEAAAVAFADAAPSGVRVDAEAMVALLLAARAG